MTTARLLDLVCFSYLADAQVLCVDQYPPANSGAVVHQTSASMAGDGPLAAVLASTRGLRVGLITNPIGEDPAGHRLLAWLERAQVSHTIRQIRTIGTPQLTVIADGSDTRTWFASTQHVSQHLLTVDLALITRARLLYVDCYRVLDKAAARVIDAAIDTPLLLNLGGDPLDPHLVELAHGRQIRAVQTSLDETRATEAESYAENLFRQLHPDAAIVTVGRLGAVAHTALGTCRVAAPEAPSITHTHGAGAAFSAGYAHALLSGADITTALHAGCAAGTEHCSGQSATVPRQLPAATFAA